MTWFKVCDTLAHHWKVSAAGNAAMGLWVRAGSWSMQNLTDGHIPAHVLRSLGTRAQAERLVWAGLWDPDPLDGWRFHDFKSMQPTRAQIEYRRESAAMRQNRRRNTRRGGDGRYEKRAPEQDPNVFPTRSGDANTINDHGESLDEESESPEQ